ncbi:MAG: regulatory protein RecX [Gemmatimonadaceae bacterium]
MKRPLGAVDQVPEGVVTGLSERRAGSARYVICVNGQPAATISSEVIGTLGLRTGTRIDAALAAAVQEASGRLEVYDKAIAFLAARARSEREMRTKLRLAGANDAAVGETVERLLHLGLLDDAQYARALAHSRAVGGGMSRLRIAMELQRRGVSRPVADAAIAETLEEVQLDEEGAARAAAEKRLRALRSLGPEVQRRRLYAFLARRGYPHDVVSRVLRALL